MPTVRDILGPHAYTLVRYGIYPDDDIYTAVRKLDAAAPHLAKFIRELYPTAAGGV
ncbi:MAG: hypothetical protein QXD96_08760 [Pyrobaculum sp.]